MINIEKEELKKLYDEVSFELNNLARLTGFGGKKLGSIAGIGAALLAVS